MLWVCSTYVSTFLIEIGYVLTVLYLLYLYFESARPMFRLCSTYVLTVLDVCFDFLDQKRVCLDCARRTFRITWVNWKKIILYVFQWIFWWSLIWKKIYKILLNGKFLHRRHIFSNSITHFFSFPDKSGLKLLM